MNSTKIPFQWLLEKEIKSREQAQQETAGKLVLKALMEALDEKFLFDEILDYSHRECEGERAPEKHSYSEGWRGDKKGDQMEMMRATENNWKIGAS